MPTGYSYYKQHTLAGSADGTLTDFQMRVVCRKGSGTDSGEDVYLGSNVLDSFLDVRFTTSDGSTDLQFWRDQSQLTSGTSCVFWVKVPSIAVSPSTTDIRVYYGNVSASAADSIQATMLGGDDFRTMRQTIQINSGSSPRWVNGVYHLSGTTIFHTLWDSTTLQHWLYSSTDGCATAPTSVSTIYAASSARSHSNLTGDGSTTLWAVVKSSTAAGVYVKASTDSGATWGSEVTVESGLTGVTDPTPLYVSGSQLLIFARVTSGGNNIIRCYESTDDGATWSTKGTVHSETSTGINGLEDIDAVLLSSGRILVAWERETAEVGEARCDYCYSDDDGATWSTVDTIINNSGTIDDEGGSFAKRADGTLDYIFGSNIGGGTSYLKQQAWITTYDEGGDSWSTPTLLNESYDGVENNATYITDDVLVLFNTRQYAHSGGDSTTYTATVTRLNGDDWSDRNWTQDDGIAYATSGGAWVEGFTHSGGERGFLSFDDFSGGDAVVEMLASAPSPLTQVDLRMLLRYGTASDHYMLGLIGNAVNQVQWYKRISGTYTSLSTGSYTPSINTLYRIIATLRGTNPTTLTVTVNGSTVLSSVTEGTSTRTTGKIGVSAPTVANRRATLARHIFARKYTANPPTHGAWGGEQFQATLAATLLDAAGGTDITSAQPTVARSLVDAAGGVDLVNAGAVVNGTLVEGVSAVDLSSALATLSVTVSEAVTVVELLAATRIAHVAATEAAAGADISSTGTSLSGSLVDAVVSADALSAAATLVASVLEAGGVVDQIHAAAQLVVLLTEPATAVDSVAGAQGATYTASVTEVLAAAELLVAVLAAQGVISAPPLGHGFGMSRRVTQAGRSRPANLNSRTR